MGTLTVILATGERRPYTDDENFAVGVSFGVDERNGWLHVMRHNLHEDIWETYAFYPTGGWIGVESDRHALPEAPAGVGFQGPAHNRAARQAADEKRLRAAGH